MLLSDVFFDREPSRPRLSSLFLRQTTKVHQPLGVLILGQMHQGKAAFHLNWVIQLLFFSHSLTVLRATPNVLVNPLKLLRSSYDLSISSRLSFEYAYSVGFSRLCFLHSLQKYFCFPFGAWPFLFNLSLPQCEQRTVMVTMFFPFSNLFGHPFILP